MSGWRRSTRQSLRRFAALVASLALLTVGCASVVTTDGSATLDTIPGDEVASDDGKDGDAATTTSVVEETASTTASAAADQPPDDSSPNDRVAASFSTFVADWDNLNATLNADNPDIDRIELTEGDFVQTEGVDGKQVFAGQVTETAILGGTVDAATGAVPALVVGVDPDGDTAAPAVITTFGITAAAGQSLGELVAAYTDVATGPVGGDAYVVSGTNDFVIEKVEGAEADDPLLLVTVAPVTDPETAREAAAMAKVSVFNALLGE